MGRGRAKAQVPLQGFYLQVIHYVLIQKVTVCQRIALTL